MWFLNLKYGMKFLNCNNIQQFWMLLFILAFHNVFNVNFR